MSRLTDQMDQSAAWLADQRDVQSGGWGEEHLSNRQSTLNTAEAIIALIDADADAVDSDAVRDGVAFLRDRQAQAGEPDPGSWRREEADEGRGLVRHADVVRTGLAFEALVRAGRPVYERASWRPSGGCTRVRTPTAGGAAPPGGHTRILQTCSTRSTP